MTDKSVFAHEPDSTKRRSNDDGDLYANSSAGRHRGKALTPEQRQQERQAKGYAIGTPGVGGEIEIADPADERGIQHGYGKNQDQEPERKTARNQSQGAH